MTDSAPSPQDLRHDGRDCDVAIVGGGPAGLSAALVLARGCKRVLLCDAGPARNAAATHVNGFVTRDGTPPAELRRLGRAELGRYPAVTVRASRVVAIDGSHGRFRVTLDDETAGQETVTAARVVLAGGVHDELLPLPGYRELWGKAVFQCPYCHAWELRGRVFGYLAPAAEQLEWGLFLRGWSPEVIAFTDGRFAVGDELRARLAAAGVRLVERPLRRLVARGDELVAVALDDGTEVPCGALVSRPPQRQTALVAGLGLALDGNGYLRVDERGLTSRPGIYAAGDLTTPFQGALVSAAAGAMVAYQLNHELTVEQVTSGGARASATPPASAHGHAGTGG